MKIKSTLLAIAAFSAFGAVSSQAATIVWNFGDDDAVFDTGTPVNFSVSALTLGNSLGTIADAVNPTSPSSGYTGASGTGNIGNAYRIGALDTGASGSGFIEFTLTPSAGFTLSLTDLDFGARSTGTGPLAYSLRSSADSYVANITTGTIVANSNWSLRNNTFTAFNSTVPGGAVTFRLFGHGGAGNPSASTANGRFDDISLTVTAVPEPSTALLGALGMLALLRRRR